MNTTSKRVMISHSSLDGDLADMLAQVIRTCSLQTISVWHSSDRAVDAGLAPGQRWFDTISNNLRKSDAIIILLTPNSVNSSWVHFEAGFGAGVSTHEIMPLILGVEINQVPDPLSQWQAYYSDDPGKLMTFLRKLFGKFYVHFDDGLVRDVVFTFADRCKSENFECDQNKATIDVKIDSLRAALEKSLGEINKKLTLIRSRHPEWEEATGDGFDIAIQNKISDDFVTVFVEDGSSVADVYNQIYAQIQKSVKAWSYLSSWILKDVDTGKQIIIREVSDEIPAHYVFYADRVLEIIPLEHPYTGDDSEDIDE